MHLHNTFFRDPLFPMYNRKKYGRLSARRIFHAIIRCCALNSQLTLDITGVQQMVCLLTARFTQIFCIQRLADDTILR